MRSARDPAPAFRLPLPARPSRPDAMGACGIDGIVRGLTRRSGEGRFAAAAVRRARRQGRVGLSMHGVRRGRHDRGRWPERGAHARRRRGGCLDLRRACVARDGAPGPLRRSSSMAPVGTSTRSAPRVSGSRADTARARQSNSLRTASAVTACRTSAGRRGELPWLKPTTKLVARRSGARRSAPRRAGAPRTRSS